MKKPKVSLIILNYHNYPHTRDCLQSIAQLKVGHYRLETIVIDNASNDGSVSQIHQQFPQVKLIANQTNLGYCQANNQGMEYAYQHHHDYLILLNNDTEVDVNLINSLLAVAQKTNAGLISPKIYFYPGREFHRERYSAHQLGKVIWYAGGQIDWSNLLVSHRGVDEVDHGQFETTSETDFATGCCLLLKRQVIDKIGYLDPIYFAYFEDVDFSLRAKKAGFKVLYTSQAKVWHKNAGSFGGSGSLFQDYFLTRNRVIFGLKYASLRTKLALIRQSLKYTLSDSPIRRRAVLDAFLRRLNPPQLT